MTPRDTTSSVAVAAVAVSAWVARQAAAVTAAASSLLRAGMANLLWSGRQRGARVRRHGVADASHGSGRTAVKWFAWNLPMSKLLVVAVGRLRFGNLTGCLITGPFRSPEADGSQTRG
ncbi:hypothetical protein GCM10010372_21870 [Streptomyces tauricus]|nr:hypothetical protein GCM10010372_21870 [Streptomyces tauricus]